MNKACRRGSLEQRFFTWGAWDFIDVGFLGFYDCEFVVDFGPIEAGSKFDYVSINYEAGVVEAFATADDREPTHAVSFTLTPVPT